MRLTEKNLAQHIGWMFKQQWKRQGQRVPREILDLQIPSTNKTVLTAEEVLSNRKKTDRLPLSAKDSLIDTQTSMLSDVCYQYGDLDILIGGLKQACLITKSVAHNRLPKRLEESIERCSVNNIVDRHIVSSIMAANVFDAEQTKLPKKKLPERPAYNFPRIYGTSNGRKSRLLTNKIIRECENMLSRTTNLQRKSVDDVDFCVTFIKNQKVMNFNIKIEKYFTSSQPLVPLNCEVYDKLTPIFPLEFTISLPKTNLQKNIESFPLAPRDNICHPHTLLFTINENVIRNLHNNNVNESQLHSRNLLKAFTVAAARAKQLYGESFCEDLPKPIVIRSIQTNGKCFYFGIFQLNTLSLDGTDGTKNYWWHKPVMNLFSETNYQFGKQVVKDYNNDVYRHFNIFLKNN